VRNRNRLHDLRRREMQLLKMACERSEGQQSNGGMTEPTIRDVARRAQVSIASVSRALNGLGNVAEKTRVKVELAARDLGYVPHAGARSLSLARTSAIGVVLPDVHGEFFSEVMRGMDREASRRDYVLLLSNMHGGSAQAEKALRAMRGRVDGLVVMAPHLDATAVEQALPPRLPAVLLNAQGEVHSHSSFGIDNRRGVTDIVDHFFETGRARVAHVAGPKGNVDAEERCEAFIAAIARRGEPAIVVRGDYSEESGAAAARELLRRGEPVDAIFAANDMMAIGAMDALRSAGRAVPGEIAVAGFDDVPIARHIGLTTARVRIDELGAQAIGRLIDLIEHGIEDPVRALLPPELVVRGSSAPKTGARA
jgi:LacI family transcriptional regulator